MVYTVQTISLTGLNMTTVAAAASDTFANDGHVFLLVKTGATATDVTVTAQNPCSQGVTHNIVVSVAINLTMLIGPFPPARFNNASGNVTVACSGTRTNVTIAAVKLVA